MTEGLLRILALVLVCRPALILPAPPRQAVERRQEEAAVSDTVVVTASRREEQLMNAPATMTVVSEEAGTGVPWRPMADMLRLVPGLNVVQTSARDVNVTARAATGTLSDSMLVLLDGRSVYQDFFGAVLWDFLPVDSAEIKQIEVIRGPASAVWGANAMTGVVNVITKTPREIALADAESKQVGQGTSLAIRFGQFDRSPKDGPFDGGGLFSISAVHAQATSDRFAYKVSAGFLTQEPFARPTGNLPGQTTAYPAFVNQGTTQPRLDARVDYDLADKRQSISLAGGIAGTEGILHSGLGPLDTQRGSTLKYGRITYARGKLRLQTFVNALDGEARALLLKNVLGGPLDFGFENQAYDAEFSNLHVLGERHVLSYGGNYRHNNFDLEIAPRGVNRDEGGAYVQDDFLLSPRYRMTAGIRVDRFDVLKKTVFSPRMAFLVKPSSQQTIRFSFNRAFRAPSFVNSYMQTAFLNQADLGAAGPFEFPSVAVGNESLREEGLTAYEAGYIGTFRRGTFGATTYLNRTKNAIQFTQTGSYTTAAPPPGWLEGLTVPVGVFPSRFTYLNFDSITDRGLELSADVRLNAGVSGFANYSWQGEPKIEGFDAAEVNLPPRHRFNAGVQGGRSRYTGSLSASFVDAAFWQDVLPTHRGWTAAYTIVDGAFAVHSTDQSMTVGVRGSNLLNSQVQQHVFGDVIGRSVTGEVRFQF